MLVNRTGHIEQKRIEPAECKEQVGILYWYGHPLGRLYEIFERFASRVFHTHCKSVRFPQDKKNVQRPMGWEYGKYAFAIYEGDIDFARVAAILRKAGYSGDPCLENESLGKCPDKRHAEILKKGNRPAEPAPNR